ncbi:MAG: DUF169 domain-containing protein [Candidatus Methanosuratincola sp.]
MEYLSKLYRYLKPKSHIIGIKFFNRKEEMEGLGKGFRRPRKKLTICQILNTARLYGWSWMVFAEDAECILGSVSLGLVDEDETIKSGEIFLKLGYVSDREFARKFSEAIPKLKEMKAGFIAGPLESLELEPDLVLIYGNAAQMLRAINGAVYATKERLTFGTVGDVGVCGDGIAEAYNTQKPQVVIACYGERRFGHTSDDELLMVVPFRYVVSMAEGLEKTHNAGIRYPIPVAATIAELGIPEVLRTCPKK